MSLRAWLRALAEPAALVTVIATRGSTPRAAGAAMLVTASGQHGTIGGGELEWRVAAAARARLGDRRGQRVSLPLGPELGQCCGGVVEVLIQPLDPAMVRTLDLDGADAVLVQDPAGGTLTVERDGAAPAFAVDGAGRVRQRLAAGPAPVWLFGAGHVGRALVAVLALLPEQEIVWIDERPGMFPSPLPALVTAVPAHVPEQLVTRAPAGARLVVMTHSHARDLAIVAAALARTDLAFLGLIGSATKRSRFVHRLRQLGHDEASLARLVCPIGVPTVTGKAPEVIAIAVAAQLLETRDG